MRFFLGFGVVGVEGVTGVVCEVGGVLEAGVGVDGVSEGVVASHLLLAKTGAGADCWRICLDGTARARKRVAERNMMGELGGVECWLRRRRRFRKSRFLLANIPYQTAFPIRRYACTAAAKSSGRGRMICRSHCFVRSSIRRALSEHALATETDCPAGPRPPPTIRSHFPNFDPTKDSV